MTKKVYQSVNWNQPTDDYTRSILEKNWEQFWTDNDLLLENDISVWQNLPDQVKKTFIGVFGGLTVLDTNQSPGMSIISVVTEDPQVQAVFAFMSAMESIHASFYSSVFSTILSKKEIDDVHAWAESNPHLQAKMKLIDGNYKKVLLDYATNGTVTDKATLYKALVSSVLLESFLFYSGFFYPLYLGGQGIMIQSSIGIKLIVRDEAVHGVYVGRKAQEVLQDIEDESARKALVADVYSLLKELMVIEEAYTEEMYSDVGLVEDVQQFLKYNADRALMNLGLDVLYEVTDEDINPIVLNGMSTATIHSDIFSTQNNGYVIPMNVEPLTDAHIFIEPVDEFGDVA